MNGLRRLLSWGLATLLGALGGLALPARSENSASTAFDAYRQGNFRGSQAQYSELAKKAPEDPRLRFNAGAAAYQQNDLTNAATWFESVLGSPDLKLQQQAYYNLGNSRFKLGEAIPDPQARKQFWNEALTNFVSAMKLDAADTNSAANYTYVRQQLEQLERQLPPPQPPQPKSDQDSKSEDKDPSDNSSQKDSNSKEQSDSKQPQPDKPSSENSPKDQEDQPTADPADQQKEGAQPEPKDGTNKKDNSAGQEPSQEESKGGKKSGDAQGSGKEGDAATAEAGEGKEGEMSAAQAIQMLEGQKDDEKALLLRAYGNGKEAAERAARVRKPW